MREPKRLNCLILTLALCVSFTLPAQTKKPAPSVTVPFVGCKADGQVGPQDAPSGTSKTIRIAPELAQKLAYYQAGDRIGVLAPRGWTRLTTPDRAAAILGDLTEMAATRGRLWFWIAYARTLITLGWLTPVAFVLSLAAKRFIVNAILPLEVGRRVSHLAEAGLFGAYNPHIRLIVWNLTMVLARWLIFALPFVLIRFGLRNRLSQLTCALFLFAMPVYSLRPWIMDLSSLLILITILAALISQLWRRPMIVLAATTVTAIATTVSGLYLLGMVLHHNFLWLTAFDVAIYDAIGLALAVLFCLYLNRLLLRQRPAIA